MPSEEGILLNVIAISAIYCFDSIQFYRRLKSSAKRLNYSHWVFCLKNDAEALFRCWLNLITDTLRQVGNIKQVIYSLPLAANVAKLLLGKIASETIQANSPC